MNIRKVSATNESVVSNDQSTKLSNNALFSTIPDSTTTPHKGSIMTDAYKGTDPYKMSDLKYSIITEAPLNYNDSASLSQLISLKGSRDQSQLINDATFHSFDRYTQKSNYSRESFYIEYSERSDSLKNTKYIVFLAVSCLLGNLAVGYYWFLYNELFFRIKKPYGIPDSSES